MNAKLEGEREDIRQAVRGEFTTAMESLTLERSQLLQELSDLRLALAEVKSAKESTEKTMKREAEVEVERIHTRQVQEPITFR